MAASTGWWHAGRNEVLEGARRLYEDASATVMRDPKRFRPSLVSAIEEMGRAISGEDFPMMRYILADCFEVAYLPRGAAR